MIQLYLVGGLEHFIFFHILGIIIPTDFHIFKMVETTNQIIMSGPKHPFSSGLFFAWVGRIIGRLLAEACVFVSAIRMFAGENLLLIGNLLVVK